MNPEEIYRFWGAWPRADDQRAIASFVDRETARIDALVEKKRALVEKLAEKRSALISRTATRGLPPEAARAAGLAPHPKLKPSGVEWLGDVPEGWEVKPLGYVTRCLDGRRIPVNSEERADRPGEYPYWGANGILDHLDGWLFDEPLVLLGEDGAPFFDSRKQVAFAVEGKIWVNNHAHVLRPTAAVEGRFLVHILNCVSYAAFIDGSTRDKLTQGQMRAIPTQIPPVREQRAIAAYLDRETAKIDALVAKVETASERLQEYRAALITAAVTGKIDVRGAASAAPSAA